MKYSKALFFFILFLPLILLLLLAISNIAYQINKINRGIDHAQIYQELKNYYNSKRSEVSLDVQHGRVFITYKYNREPSMTFKREFVLDDSDEDFVIYLYGSSPIVSKPPIIGKGYLHFSTILESMLNRSSDRKIFKVYNFGMKWADSYAMKKIVELTIDYKKPDLVVIYYEGGVDYELAYRAGKIKERYYLFKSGFLKTLLTPRFLDNIRGWKIFVAYGNWFMHGYLEPRLINFIQRLRLVKIDPEPFNRYNQLVFENFKENIIDLVSYVDKKDLPIIIVTCLDNLEARPFGVYNITNRLYTLGMKEKDYYRKMEYLIKAKDSELFTEDIRAKTEAYKFLQDLIELESLNIYVFDLRQKLFKEQFEFDYNYLYDYGHLKPKANEIIADYLYEFLVQRKLILEN